MILAPDGKPARPVIERGLERSDSPRTSRPQNLWQVYEAAERADFRGYFYIPTLVPREQQNWLTRRALQERIDFLYINTAPVQYVINGLAMEEAGTGRWPKWVTSSEPFNKAMTDAFHWANHDARVFDAAGESDYYTAQYNIRRMIYRYGDCFGQLLRPSPGSFNAQCSVIPGYRVDNIGENGADWIDGTRANKLGRIISYQVRDDDRGGQGVEVSADDLLHFHDPFFPGQRRGVSCIAASARKLYRREDILKALGNGTLSRERMGFALQTKDMDSPMPSIDGEGDEEEVPCPDGAPGYTLRRLFGPESNEEIMIPKLPNGAEIKTIESNRPGTAVMEFLDDILGDLTLAVNRPREYIFHLSQLGNGTVARLVLQKVVGVEEAIRCTQLDPQFCERWVVFWAWQRILSGEFDAIGVPPDWWRHKLLGMGNKSVDIGREGRLLDDRVATGKMSIDDYHALSGEDSDDVETDNIIVIQRRMRKLAALNDSPEVRDSGIKFTYWDLWPRSVNNQPTPQEQSA